jgi:hypothetical protein
MIRVDPRGYIKSTIDPLTGYSQFMQLIVYLNYDLCVMMVIFYMVTQVRYTLRAINFPITFNDMVMMLSIGVKQK